MTTKANSYATHIVEIWLNNDEQAYRYFKQFGRDERELALHIQGYIQSLKDHEKGLVADLIGVAMADIDYKEVARRFID
jgi:hypothetical protein